MTNEHNVSFLSGMLKLELLHGITLDENEYLELAAIAWRKIGDQKIELYKLEFKDFTDTKIELPCNYYAIEAVVTDRCYCVNYSHYNNVNKLGHNVAPVMYYGDYMQKYYRQPFNGDLYNIKGSFVNYYIKNNVLYFDEDDSKYLRGSKVTLYYLGLVVDEEGYPYITEAQAEAISYYCAYIYQQRRMMRGIGDGNLVQYLFQQWRRLCADSSVPEVISQNSIDKALNAKYSWNRKSWLQSYIV